MEFWKGLREVVVDLRNDFGYKLRGEQSSVGAKVYEGSKTCRAHCIARASGAEGVFVGATCLCEGSRDELERRMVDERALQNRQGMPSEVASRLSLGSATATATATTTTTATEFDEGINDGVVTMNTVPSLAIEDFTTTTRDFVDASSTTTVTKVDDLDGTETAASTVTPKSNESTSTSSAGLETTDTPISNTSNGGLSQSSRIGLGVGLGLGLALLLAAVVYVCLARRKKRRAMQMGAKCAPHAQSDLSMIEQSRPIQMKAEQAHRPQPAEREPLQGESHEQTDTRHSQAYYEVPLPPVNVFQTPAGHSPVTPIEPDFRSRGYPGVPLALTIPGEERKSGVSREESPIHSHSPVSPVSPVSAVSPIHSRPPSPKAQ